MPNGNIDLWGTLVPVPYPKQHTNQCHLVSLIFMQGIISRIAEYTNQNNQQMEHIQDVKRLQISFLESKFIHLNQRRIDSILGVLVGEIKIIIKTRRFTLLFICYGYLITK